MQVASRIIRQPACHLLACWFLAELISSTLKMDAICSSETSVDTKRTTRRYIPEVDNLHNHRCENLKSYRRKKCLNTFNFWVLICGILNSFLKFNFFLEPEGEEQMFGLFPSCRRSGQEAYLSSNCVRFGVLTAINTKITVFWDVTPYNMVKM
jgi:hypothetical protein